MNPAPRSPHQTGHGCAGGRSHNRHQCTFLSLSTPLVKQKPPGRADPARSVQLHTELWALWRRPSPAEGTELHGAALGAEWPLVAVTFPPGSPPPRALQDGTGSSKLRGNPCSVSPGKKKRSCFLLAEQSLQLALGVQMGRDRICTPPGLGESCSAQRSRRCRFPRRLHAGERQRSARVGNVAAVLVRDKRGAAQSCHELQYAAIPPACCTEGCVPGVGWKSTHN